MGSLKPWGPKPWISWRCLYLALFRRCAYVQTVSTLCSWNISSYLLNKLSWCHTHTCDSRDWT